MLKTKMIDTAIGQVEVRELTYAVAEPLLALPAEEMGKAFLKASIYRDGKLAFDDQLSLSDAMVLYQLSGEVLEVNGLSGKRKG